jgi:hypothetical protein
MRKCLAHQFLTLLDTKQENVARKRTIVLCELTSGKLIKTALGAEIERVVTYRRIMKRLLRVGRELFVGV